MSPKLDSITFPLASDTAFLYGAILATCVLAFRVVKHLRTSARASTDDLPLPPGPKPLPLIGNVFDMPMKEPWETFTRWGKQYGEVVHVSVFNQSIIILNSPRAINDLFEKRSSLYSDRPRLPLVGELGSCSDWLFPLMHYGDLWREYRRVFMTKFGPGGVQMFNPAQDFASSRLLGLLLEGPDEFEDHIRLHMAQDIMISVYGIIPEDRDDEFVILAERSVAAFSDLGRPGLFLVDTFPILKKVPSWVPGASSQEKARQMASDLQAMRDVPFFVSKEKMATGRLPVPCFVSELLGNQEQIRNKKLDREVERIIQDCSQVAYGAGADTCVAALSSFILSMSLNLDVQKKAQTELDSVVGVSRLPTHEDRDDLPYVTAVMKEVLRWHVVAPQGLPHMLKEDDVYEGYHFPKGAIVLGNTWGILHDSALYPDPMEFKPERYFSSEGHLDLSANDPAKYAFGYGRRVCPGSYFAENALHLAISRILATFNISPAKDVNGMLFPAALRATSGVVSHPGSFKCTITRRSEQAVTLIRQANANMSQMYKA